MSVDLNWSAPPLAPEDARLIDAYLRIGRPVDDLAYTSDFDEICRSAVDGPIDEPRKHSLYKRLLYLRKMGRLPRAGN